MEICGEEDRFRGQKIQIATLQISKNFSDTKRSELIGHGHLRKDIAEYFRKEPHGEIHYTQLFEEVKKHVLKNSDKPFTDAAKEQFFVRYGNLVVIAGQPGIGKSTLTKHMVKEMWENSLFNPDIIFFIRFRDIDYQVKTDLLGFLAPFVSFISNKKDRKNILEKIEKTENIFIILDGMDEANINPQMKNASKYCIDEDFSAEVYIQNLVAGNILPRSKKMITSRPYRIDQLPEDFKPKLVFNIQGLDESAFKQICLNICSKNHVVFNKIKSHLECHPDLKSYCQIPVICIMVVESLYKVYATEKYDLDSYHANALSEESYVDTMTTIFVLALQKWLKPKFECTASSFQLKEISELALEGFVKNRFYFQDYHIRKAKIDYQNTTTFLNAIFKGSQTTQMHFVHLTWHEFLTSVNMRFYSKGKEFETYLENFDNRKYEFVARFLFGLCRTRTFHELLDFVKSDDLRSDEDYEESTTMLKKFAIAKLEIHRNNQKQSYDEYFESVLPILGWIYEMRDDDFTQQAAACLKNEIRIRGKIIPSDIPIINYFLRHRKCFILLRVVDPCFVGNSFEYFFKELQITLDRNPNIQVSLKILKIALYKVYGSQHIIDRHSQTK